MKAIAAALVAITLLGCGNTVGTEDETWARNNVNDISAQMGEREGDTVLYLNIIASEYPALIPTMGADWVVEFGENVCGSIDGGWNWETIKGLNTDRPDLDDEIAFMVAAAVAIFCPENEDALFS